MARKDLISPDHQTKHQLSARIFHTQRGAPECQAWNERIYLASSIWLRLRRAPFLSGMARAL